MSSLLSYFDQIRHQWLAPSFGWTGIEIGCHEIKMAQVRKLGSRWQLEAVWTVDHPTPYVNPNHASSEELFGWIPIDKLKSGGLSPTFENLVSLKSLFRGRNCAATLTDGIIEYRELDLPPCGVSESHAMVCSEIALEKECELEELLTECWDLLQTRPRSQASCFATVSLEKSTALRFARDLMNAGFECRALDAVPCAMARATSMAVEDGEQSVLTIDLGYQQATLTLVKQGQPLLSRGIRSLGLVSWLESIATSFGVSMSDAQTLLFQSTGNHVEKSCENFEFSNPLQQKLGSYLQSFTVELDRTIHFASQVCRSASPTQILLMGPGTRIPGIDQALARRIGLPANIWSIDVSENLFGNQCIAAYAISAALSSLAFEAQ